MAQNVLVRNKIDILARLGHPCAVAPGRENIGEFDFKSNKSLPGEIKLTSKALFLRLGSVTFYEWPASLISAADGLM